MRLTHKHKYKKDSQRFVFDMKDYRKACQKFGQLEDILENHNIETLEELDDLLSYVKQIKGIEDELGIDLITLFKALKNGIWIKYKKFWEKQYNTKLLEPREFAICFHDNMIMLCKVDYCMDDCSISDSVRSIEIHGDFDEVYYLTSQNYRKTWALRKEDLQ